MSPWPRQVIEIRSKKVSETVIFDNILISQIGLMGELSGLLDRENALPADLLQTKFRMRKPSPFIRSA